QAFAASQLAQVRDQLQNANNENFRDLYTVIQMIQPERSGSDGDPAPAPVEDGELSIVDMVVALSELNEPFVYTNTSLSEYLAQSGIDRAITIGDSGGYVEPIFDATGAIVDLRFHSWIIGDQPGYYATTLTTGRTFAVPEPGAWMMLMVVSLSSFLIRRRLSQAR